MGESNFRCDDRLGVDLRLGDVFFLGVRFGVNLRFGVGLLHLGVVAGRFGDVVVVENIVGCNILTLILNVFPIFLGAGRNVFNI